MIDPQMLAQYAVLTKTIDGLTEDREILKDHIVGAMREADIRLLETEHGKFMFVARPTYAFSDKVKAAKEEVKKLEELEKADGTAKSQTTESLSFRAAK